MVHAYVRSSRGYALECPIPVVTAVLNLISPRHQSRPLQADVLSLHLFLPLVEVVVCRTLSPRRILRHCHYHCRAQSRPLHHRDQYPDARFE